jgi:hypothetical protein
MYVCTYACLIVCESNPQLQDARVCVHVYVYVCVYVCMFDCLRKQSTAAGCTRMCA